MLSDQLTHAIVSCRNLASRVCDYYVDVGPLMWRLQDQQTGNSTTSGQKDVCPAVSYFNWVDERGFSSRFFFCPKAGKRLLISPSPISSFRMYQNGDFRKLVPTSENNPWTSMELKAPRPIA